MRQPVDQEPGDEVSGDPVHQEVNHQDPRGDEEYAAAEVDGLPLTRADVSGHPPGQGSLALVMSML